ncbi:MAG: sugar phosphate nucleotidyltransferase [Victivallales bacterium]|nr:sugar phosphate nucleotidyltransferase [Victivallales bacterium]
MNRENIFAIVMAGGKGERFWPQSRASRPKQLLRLIGSLTLIEQTVARFDEMLPPDHIIIITNQDYVAPMRSLLPRIPAENIVGEPVGRDTGPCVALAAAMVRARAEGDDAVMIMLPADHVIHDTASLLQVVRDSVTAAAAGHIVTIGVDPVFPSTGYGYIHCGERETVGDLATAFYHSEGFREKPDVATAEKFVAEKCYLWNSGMFIWSESVLTAALRRYAPALAALRDNLYRAALEGRLTAQLVTEYRQCRKISIDYAVMEQVDNVIVARATFDWDDVGSWTALRNQIRPEKSNNVVRGLHESIGTSDCVIVSDAKHLVATVDVSDLIIVHTDDVTLVCNARSAQKIKDLVQQIGSKPELAQFL